MDPMDRNDAMILITIIIMVLVLAVGFIVIPAL